MALYLVFLNRDDEQYIVLSGFQSKYNSRNTVQFHVSSAHRFGQSHLALLDMHREVFVF